MIEQKKALYLLADSQLLFWNAEQSRLICSIRKELQIDQASVTRAAYIGVNNGDKPEFFELFVAAMDRIDIHESRMICADFSQEDRQFLESADLVLLAGGHFSDGWKHMLKSGLAEMISQKYYAGAVIVGISAGAIQLGMGGVSLSERSEFVDTLQLFPYFLDVDDEKNDWYDLKQIVLQKQSFMKGYGISSGGGLIYHPERGIEPLRKSINEFHQSDDEKGKILSNILLPPTEDTVVSYSI